METFAPMNGGRKIRPTRVLIILIISEHYILCAKTLNSLSTRADLSLISVSVNTLEGELSMTLRLLSFICTVTAASLMTSIMVSCGGGAMSGGADAQKGKNSAESDDDATDPQVIAGAYLTCDYTSEANAEVGCGLRRSDGTNITPTKSERIDYVANTGATEVPPTSRNASYDAVFSGVKNISTTKFLARLYRNTTKISESTKISEWSCDGSKLPCKPVVTRGNGGTPPKPALQNLSGYWSGGDSMTDSFIEGSKAEVFCDGNGVKSKTEIVDAFKKWNRILALGSIVANPPSESQKINSVQSMPACKKTIKSGPSCKVVPVRLLNLDNGQLKPSRILTVLIYKDGSDMTELDKITGNCN